MKQNLNITSTAIMGLYVVERQVRQDVRGFFERLFCLDTLREYGWSDEVVQMNHSYTKSKGTVRGLHYQLPPHSEHKLVTCV
ncbi:MAG: dTDP-4-dehydrorhamnose 3,5-epimerase family protein, partial [Undibacterium sp.]|nr:dTDP-4-dehydrorhamnose 3,5-epimerase family protein [Undibacterium sp.]